MLRDVKNHPENMGEATLKQRLERAMELKKHKLGLKEDGDDWFSSEEQKKDDAALESEEAALPKKRGKRKGKLDLDAETIKTSDKAIKAAGGPRDKGKHSRLRASSAPRATARPRQGRRRHHRRPLPRRPRRHPRPLGRRVQLLPRAEAGRCEVRAPLGRV